MSPLVTLAVVLAIVGSASTALAQKPLELSGSFGSERPGPLERQAKPVTADNPIPRRSVFVAPRYPDSAALVEARVVVPLRVTVDESGYVGEVRRIGAPPLGAWRHPLLTGESMSSVFEALVSASTDAVRQWRYDAPHEGPIAFDVAISFGPDVEPRVVTQPIAVAPEISTPMLPEITP